LLRDGGSGSWHFADDFISPHQADVTLDIGGENRGELSFDRVRFHGSAPPQPRVYTYLVRDPRASQPL